MRAPSRRRASTRTSRSSGGNVPGAAVSKTKRAQVGEVVVGEPGLGHAGELEQQHVPALGLLGPVLAAQARRDGPLRGVQDRQRPDHRGQAPGEAPGEAAAPVVAHHVGALVPERADQPRDVADQRPRGVVLHRRGSVRAAEAAQVGRHGVVPGLRQGRELVAPGVGQLGEPVQQHDRLAGRIAGLGDRQAHLADVDPAARRLSQRGPPRGPRAGSPRRGPRPCRPRPGSGS